MKLSMDIARRYLLGKKSTNAINYITWISIAGIAIGTAALVLILSVFNGFQTFISGMYNAFNPDLKVVAYEGKYFDIDSSKVASLEQLPGVIAISQTLEEVALFDYKEIQKPGIIKGVDEAYIKVSGIDSTISRGNMNITDESPYYGLVGRVLSVNLSINPKDKLTPISIYMPLRKKNSFTAKMGKEFKKMSLYPSGVFNVGGDTDAQYMLASKTFVEKLLDLKGKISALEIKTNEEANEENLRASIKSIIGQNITIKNRYEQDAAFLRIMNIEKWISFLIVSMVLIIIAFNMVGSLWMMVLEKKKDISILRSMGYDTQQIRGIFIWEGLLISAIGIVIGIVIALTLYVLQKQYGIVGIPDGFMIDAYPIDIRWSDFIIIIITVLSIGGLASLLPAMRAGQVTATVREE